jgi:hypothetical protein
MTKTWFITVTSIGFGHEMTEPLLERGALRSDAV